MTTTPTPQQSQPAKNDHQSVAANDHQKSETPKNWYPIKAEIKSTWSKLTDEDLDKTLGVRSEVISLLAKRYEQEIDKNTKRVNEIFQTHERSGLAKTNEPSSSKTH